MQTQSTRPLSEREKARAHDTTTAALRALVGAVRLYLAHHPFTTEGTRGALTRAVFDAEKALATKESMP
jgi:hypothetical protein